MKKYMAVILAVVMILGLTGCNNRSENLDVKDESSDTGAVIEGTYTQISMAEAVVMMEEETDYIILDVRTPEEFAEKHIPNALNVPNESIGDEPVPELPEKDQLILVYCRSGNRSKQAAEKLVSLGYTNVYEFGGINDWTGETESGK